MADLVEPYPKPTKREGRGLRRSRLNPIGRKGRQRRTAWGKVAEKLQKQSGGLCQACQVHHLPTCSGRYEHPHHIRPRGVGGQDVIGNALAVGSVHHRWIHEHPFEAKVLGFLR